MPVTFAHLSERAYRNRMYILDVLDRFSKSGMATPAIRGAVSTGCTSMENPPMGDPKLLFVMNFTVDKDLNERAVYTVLFAVAASFHRLAVMATSGGGYETLSFETLSNHEFNRLVTTTEANVNAANAYRDERTAVVFDLVNGSARYQLGDDLPDVPNPSGVVQLPSDGLYGKTPGAGGSNYGKTPAAPVYGHTPASPTYARTPQTGAPTPPSSKTGALRRVSSLRKIFGS